MGKITGYYAKQIFGEFYGAHWRLFLTVALFSFYTSANTAKLREQGCSAIVCALLAMSDYYYFVFYFLILYSLMILSFIRGKSACVTVRTGRRFRDYAAKMLAVALFTFAVVFLHAVLAFALGISGQNPENKFRDIPASLSGFSEINAVFQNNFATPLSALIAVCLFLGLGLCVYAGIIILVSEMLPKKATVFAVVLFYILTVAALNRGADARALQLFPVNYLFLHRALLNGIAPKLLRNEAVAAAVLLFLADRQRGRCFKKLKIPLRVFGELLTRRRVLLFFAFFAAISALNVIKNYSPAHAGLDYAALQFLGYGGGYLNLVEFFGLLLINGVPAYVLCVWLGNENSMRGMVLLRYRSAKKFFFHLQLSMLAAAVAEVFFLFAANAVAGGVAVCIAGTRAGGASEISAAMLCGGMVSRVMELMCVQMLCLLCAGVFRSATGAFLAALSGYATLIFCNLKWNPFGLSSLYRTAQLSGFWEKMIPYLIFVGIYMLFYPVAEKMFGTKICEKGTIKWKKR